MKRLVYIFAVLLLGITNATAQKILIEDCEVPVGGVAKVAVKYQGVNLTATRFNLTLPEGLELVMSEDSEEEAFAELDEANSKGFSLVTSTNGFAVFATGSGHFAGEEGTVLTFKIKANADLTVGDVKEVTVRNIETSDDDADYKQDDFTFKVTIADSRLVFHEEKAAPEFTAGQKYDAKAIRTIKAGNWSSIVLPFALSAAEYQAVFGSDVKLARLTGLNVEYEEGGKKIKNLDLLFNTHTAAMAAGRPYLILTSQEKEDPYEISIDGKALQAVKADQKGIFSEEDDETGEEINITALFVGTYEGATIPANGIFLNSNKFYTSVGLTKTKGLRGWFDVDAAVGQDMSAAKIGFIVDGEPTTVDGIPSYQRVVEGVYDLSGRKIQLKDGDLNKLQKGVYIIDGKKVTIK